MGFGPLGVVWPDMHATTTTYLTAALAARTEPVTDSVHVGAVKLDGKARQVVVRVDGGQPVADLRAVCRLGINVWAQTEDDAGALAALVTAALNAWPDGRPVVRSRATIGYPVPDPAGPLRYLTCELVVRGEPF